MILKDEDKNHLAGKVNELISDSSTTWQPYGDLQCVYDREDGKKIIYIQAMVGGK